MLDAGSAGVLTCGMHTTSRFAVAVAAAVLAVPTPARSANLVSGTKKVAVILFDFQDSAATRPFTPADVRGWVFTNVDSTRALYLEMSGGLVSLEGSLDSGGDVFGWYRLSVNGSGNCDPVGWTNEAETLAAADGFVPTAYDHIITSTPTPGGC